jgi:tRNA A37 N6-isopentenylltransferase MiaA
MESGPGKVVVVMGATGAGKSRLAVDLAAHFAGVEVVNADSMQVYRGLDVLTNKIPLREQNGLSFLSLFFHSFELNDAALNGSRCSSPPPQCNRSLRRVHLP